MTVCERDRCTVLHGAFCVFHAHEGRLKKRKRHELGEADRPGRVVLAPRGGSRPAISTR